MSTVLLHKFILLQTLFEDDIIMFTIQLVVGLHKKLWSKLAQFSRDSQIDAHDQHEVKVFITDLSLCS